MREDGPLQKANFVSIVANSRWSVVVAELES
jgi:hypothetical protein